jgi:hypothetical protein
VNVYDGNAFSNPKEFHVNVPANHAPTLMAPDQSATAGQVFNASSLFAANDADGDTLTYYFYDNSADPSSGHFTVNGVVQRLIRAAGRNRPDVRAFASRNLNQAVWASCSIAASSGDDSRYDILAL